jgi:hypothetical protein
MKESIGAVMMEKGQRRCATLLLFLDSFGREFIRDPTRAPALQAHIR